jgi:hypothetical protein
VKCEEVTANTIHHRFENPERHIRRNRAIDRRTALGKDLRANLRCQCVAGRHDALP